MVNKEDRFEITELFMYKAGQNWHRRFMGTIKRMVGDDGKHFVCGQVEVNGCVLHAQAENEEELGLQMDSLVGMILNEGLHLATIKTTKICNTNFFMN
jgi:hypothetical protein